MNTTYSCAIAARDFNSNTNDPNRDEWTPGQIRHLIAALNGAPVAITIDKATGHTAIGVRLVEVTGCTINSDYPHVLVEYNEVNGPTSRVYHRLSNVGPFIIPLTDAGSRAKWQALDTWRAETAAAGRIARRFHADDTGDQDVPGTWTVEPGAWYVTVSFRPQLGARTAHGDRARFWYRNLKVCDVQAATGA
jgi:hypothetical protein